MLLNNFTITCIPLLTRAIYMFVCIMCTGFKLWQSTACEIVNTSYSLSNKRIHCLLCSKIYHKAVIFDALSHFQYLSFFIYLFLILVFPTLDKTVSAVWITSLWSVISKVKPEKGTKIDLKIYRSIYTALKTNKLLDFKFWKWVLFYNYSRDVINV